MNADNMESWLTRFRASDAEDVGSVDDSASYRALLGEAPEPAVRAQPEAKARAAKPSKPSHSRS